MNCKTHPRYRAVRKPTTGCKFCGLLWYIQRLRKALGFSYTTANRRTPKKTEKEREAAAAAAYSAETQEP